MRDRMRSIAYRFCMCVMFSILLFVNSKMDVRAEVITGTDGQNLTWRLENGVLTVSGKGDMYDYGHKKMEIFEWEISCFDSGRIPDAWKYWHNGCENQIKKVVVEEGITSIAPHAFSELKNAKSIQLPSTLKSIGHAAFAYSGFQSVTIPDSVTSLGEGAFYECKSLKKVKLSANLKGIKRESFNGCRKLKSIVIPEKVKSIKENAFAYCVAIKEITIPKKVQTIGGWAFKGCYKLKKLKLAKKPSLQTIGKEAFKDCKIKQFTIPASVKYLDVSAVTSCEKIQVDKKNKNYCSENGVLFSKNKKSILCYPEKKKGKTYKIPNGVKTIEEHAFYFNYNLKKLEMPDSVTLIENEGIRGMGKLKTIRFSQNLKKIKSWGLFGTRMTSLELPDSLESIGSYSFSVSQVKGDIVIPKNVKYIGEKAFQDVTSKQNVIVKSEKLTNRTYSSAFEASTDNKKKVKVFLPLSQKEKYQKIFANKLYKKELEFIYQ